MQSRNLPIVLGYFTKADAVSAAIFNSIAETLQGIFTFGTTSDLDLITTETIDRPSIVLQNPQDEIEHVFPMPPDSQKISQVLNQASSPLISQIDLKTSAGLRSYGEYLRVSETDPSTLPAPIDNNQLTESGPTRAKSPSPTSSLQAHHRVPPSPKNSRP
jgi:hypothetical protein